MKKSIYLSICVMAMAVFISCGGNTNNEEEGTSADTTAAVNQKEEPVMLEMGGIKVYEADIAKEFEDAVLTLNAPTDGDVKKAGKYNFKFTVENYELAKQTEDAQARHCANSEKGQHIHFIVNNSPYEAHYMPEFEGNLMAGNNVVLAFLSRSYHESIKTEKAHILTNYVVGDAEDDFDKSGEHMFYSRPKGSYSGKDTEKILLDFYLINTDLSANGSKVRATINGHEFILPKWAPYFVEGLPMGKNTFRLELIDNEGKMVEGPFNDSGEREITLESTATAGM